jgi:DNA (cytosine-5)-methyltransferase 1
MLNTTIMASPASTFKYICERCAHQFKRKSELDKHLQRKNPCKATNIVENPKKTVISVNMSSTPRQALSLFSGAGGDTYGLEVAGWQVSHFSEFNEPAIKTHKAAFNTSQHLTTKDGLADIKKLPDSVFTELCGKISLIFAGFPCQGFSHAGSKRQNDPRNELVHEFVRATRLIQPEWIVGENVFGLLSRKGVFPKGTQPRPIIEIIKEIFGEIGYKLTYRVFNAIEVGVPQLRRRLIIIGHRGEQYPHIPWDTLSGTTNPPTIRHILTDTLEGAIELPTQPYSPQIQSVRFWIETQYTEPLGTPHPNLVRLVSGIRNLSSKERLERAENSDQIQIIEPEGLISFGVRKSGYHGQVLDPDAPSKTIICAYNQCPRLFVGLHNPTINKYWVRTLTPSECGQIQGFPANYPWQGSVKEKITQIGNAVPPPLATTIAQLIERVVFKNTPQYSNILVSENLEDSDDEN